MTMDERLIAVEILVQDLLARCSVLEAMGKMHFKLSLIILVTILSAAGVALFVH